MDAVLLYITLALSTLLFIKLVLSSSKKKKKKKNPLPPRPRSLPIIGHLHLIKQPLHHAISSLAALHGTIFLLRFGSRPVLVVSSPALVDECFTTRDVAIANRPLFPSNRHLTYNYTASSPTRPRLLLLRRPLAQSPPHRYRRGPLVPTPLLLLCPPLPRGSLPRRTPLPRVPQRPKRFRFQEGGAEVEVVRDVAEHGDDAGCGEEVLRGGGERGGGGQGVQGDKQRCAVAGRGVDQLQLLADTEVVGLEGNTGEAKKDCGEEGQVLAGTHR